MFQIDFYTPKAPEGFPENTYWTNERERVVQCVTDLMRPEAGAGRIVITNTAEVAPEVADPQAPIALDPPKLTSSCSCGSCPLGEPWTGGVDIREALTDTDPKR